MLTRTLIAVVVGFVVGTPMVFWLLKKVRIKSKVRHVQVSLALSLPTALFVFLLQTRFAVVIIVVSVVLALLVVVLEFTLRSIIKSIRTTGARTFAMHRIGASVPLGEGRSASGSYPDDYFTEEFKTEMNLFSKSRQTYCSQFAQENGGDKSQKSYLIYQNLSFYGKQNQMENGIRNTTDSPCGFFKNSICILGASTVFNIEVPDRLTIASFLQRIINFQTDKIKVRNYGFPGATVVDRRHMLFDSIEVKSGDLLVFYFGGADAGWLDHRSGKLSQELLPLSIRALRGLADFGSEAARWLYLEVSPRGFRKYSQLAVKDTIEALDDAHEYCVSKGAQLIAILQPNIYTLRTKSEYERKLELRFSRDMKTLIIDAYKSYEVWVETVSYGVSATHIFDNAAASVFLDWAHVNARGNEIIAKFIFEELNKRKLLNVPSEV